MSSGPSASSQHRRLEEEIAASQLLHRATSRTWGCHESEVTEQASAAEIDAACLDCCLTLSCSSYKIRGTTLTVGRVSCLHSLPAHGEPGTAGISPGVLHLSWSQQSKVGGGVRSNRLLDQAWIERAGAASCGTCWRCFEQENCAQVVLLTTGTDLIISMVILGSPGRRVGG